jgi:hypothetical protein
MDGVFEMQHYYAKGGFVFSHRDVRYRTEMVEAPIVPDQGSDQIVSVHDISFYQLAEYDRTCFPAPRPTFLSQWIKQPDAAAYACLRQGKLSGYGVIRRCREGCKIGPLFADDLHAAAGLYAQLAEFAIGGPLFLDAPENNPAALALVQRHRMVDVFGCARMYLGPAPDLAHNRIFGVTTFELG